MTRCSARHPGNGLRCSFDCRHTRLGIAHRSFEGESWGGGRYVEELLERLPRLDAKLALLVQLSMYGNMVGVEVMGSNVSVRVDQYNTWFPIHGNIGIMHDRAVYNIQHLMSEHRTYVPTPGLFDDPRQSLPSNQQISPKAVINEKVEEYESPLDAASKRFALLELD